MGLDNEYESDRMTDQPHADVQRVAPEIVSQRRAAEESSRPPSTDEGEHGTGTVTTPADERTGVTADAQVRIRDIEQTLDLLDGLQCIMSSLHEEQRGRHAPDRLLDELRAIHGHGYNWEALRYQGGVGKGWSYIAASIEQLKTRLHEAHANTTK